MASIVQRGNRYNVVYLYDAEDGKRKQKWESFKTLAEEDVLLLTSDSLYE